MVREEAGRAVRCVRGIMGGAARALSEIITASGSSAPDSERVERILSIFRQLAQAASSILSATSMECHNCKPVNFLHDAAFTNCANARTKKTPRDH